MSRGLRIALAQINPKVGDVPGNLALIRKARSEAMDGAALRATVRDLLRATLGDRGARPRDLPCDERRDDLLAERPRRDPELQWLYRCEPRA